VPDQKKLRHFAGRFGALRVEKFQEEIRGGRSEGKEGFTRGKTKRHCRQRGSRVKIEIWEERTEWKVKEREGFWGKGLRI
jgi:hypothetical protein